MKRFYGQQNSTESTDPFEDPTNHLDSIKKRQRLDQSLTRDSNKQIFDIGSSDEEAPVTGKFGKAEKEEANPFDPPVYGI